jgi:4a-hydroxytetrahydrobiopterin dehydratase
LLVILLFIKELAMARPSVLSSDSIELNIKNLPNWELLDHKIVREISASNFSAAVGFVNAVAIYAESMDHYPDMLIYGWNKIRITLSTNDQGGLTELDFALAKKIEAIKININ